MFDIGKYLPLIGRIMIGVPFLTSGLGKLAAYEATVGYIDSIRLPFAPLGWLVAVIVEAGGGAAMLVGYRVRPVALLLALFSLATAVLFHRDVADQNQMIHFLKNVMLAGGLLQVVRFGAGAVSLDARDQGPRAAGDPSFEIR